MASEVSTDLKSDEGYRQTKISAPSAEVVSPYNDIDWDQVVLRKTAKHFGHPNKWDFNPISSDVIKDMVRSTIYRIGFRTQGRHVTMHQGIFYNWMSQIWYESEWDPVERQDQSRGIAQKIY